MKLKRSDECRENIRSKMISFVYLLASALETVRDRFESKEIIHRKDIVESPVDSSVKLDESEDSFACDTSEESDASFGDDVKFSIDVLSSFEASGSARFGDIKDIENPENDHPIVPGKYFHGKVTMIDRDHYDWVHLIYHSEYDPIAIAHHALLCDTFDGENVWDRYDWFNHSYWGSRDEPDIAVYFKTDSCLLKIEDAWECIGGDWARGFKLTDDGKAFAWVFGDAFYNKIHDEQPDDFPNSLEISRKWFKV